MKLRRQEAARKSEDAKLRNKVRRDYEALVKKLNELAQEENKVKASQCANLIVSILKINDFVFSFPRSIQYFI